MDLGLQDRRVLVTGASGTIGRAIAVAFGAEGARVAVGYHQHKEQAEQVAADVAAQGGTAVTLRIDLADSSSISGAVAAAERELGGIDVLVNNAVTWPERGAFGEIPLDRFRASVEANLIGHYALSQAVVAPMRATGWGRIVHVSTGLVEDGSPGSSAYTTPKAALHGLTRTMSRELASAGILTNLVMAGFVPKRELPPPVLEQVTKAAAIGRVSEAREVASLIVFLCSAANTNITGELIRADGHFLTRT
jgi:3-oxoacyl-[acyl-carrier protein] reductase